jgi:hypothetical protein
MALLSDRILPAYIYRQAGHPEATLARLRPLADARWRYDPAAGDQSPAGEQVNDAFTAEGAGEEIDNCHRGQQPLVPIDR